MSTISPLSKLDLWS